MFDGQLADVKLLHVAEFQLEFADGELADRESADGDGPKGDCADGNGTDGHGAGCYADFDNGSWAWRLEESHAGIVVPARGQVVMCRGGAGASTAIYREGGL